MRIYQEREIGGERGTEVLREGVGEKDLVSRMHRVAAAAPLCRRRALHFA